MKKTLLATPNAAEIQARVLALRADSPRQWGKMNAHQMLCHLCDSFAIAMGERAEPDASNLLMKTVGKWVVLQVPLRWPHNLPTGMSADQQRGGTPPVDFAYDQQRLLILLERFVREPRDFRFAPHPVFGKMTIAEWMRWGYLHCDHHLRQFGQ